MRPRGGGGGRAEPLRWEEHVACCTAVAVSSLARGKNAGEGIHMPECPCLSLVLLAVGPG